MKRKTWKMASFFTFPHRWSPYQEMNLNLVGRETDLVGRETGAPQRIWDSSIFTGRVGRYNMCCYVSPWEPLGSYSLPSVWWGVSCSLWSTQLVSVCGLPLRVAWKCQSMKSMQLIACAESATWFCMETPGLSASELRPFLFSLQNSLKASNRKKKRTSFKRKASKRGTEVSLC